MFMEAKSCSFFVVFYYFIILMNLIDIYFITIYFMKKWKIYSISIVLCLILFLAHLSFPHQVICTLHILQQSYFYFLWNHFLANLSQSNIEWSHPHSCWKCIEIKIFCRIVALKMVKNLKMFVKLFYIVWFGIFLNHGNMKSEGLSRSLFSTEICKISVLLSVLMWVDFVHVRKYDERECDADFSWSLNKQLFEIRKKKNFKNSFALCRKLHFVEIRNLYKVREITLNLRIPFTHEFYIGINNISDSLQKQLFLNFVHVVQFSIVQRVQFTLVSECKGVLKIIVSTFIHVYDLEKQVSSSQGEWVGFG